MKQKRKEELDELRRNQLEEYTSRRSLLANEKSNETPHDYSKIFDFANDGSAKRNLEIRENIRSWIRYGLMSGLTYDDIKGVVMSEFRLHKQAIDIINPKPKKKRPPKKP